MHMPRQQQQRNAKLFCIFSFVFCTAAIAAGICFVYAVQMGLETLALYQPLAAGASLDYFPQVCRIYIGLSFELYNCLKILIKYSC